PVRPAPDERSDRAAEGTHERRRCEPEAAVEGVQVDAERGGAVDDGVDVERQRIGQGEEDRPRRGHPGVEREDQRGQVSRYGGPRQAEPEQEKDREGKGWIDRDEDTSVPEWDRDGIPCLACLDQADSDEREARQRPHDDQVAVLPTRAGTPNSESERVRPPKWAD